MKLGDVVNESVLLCDANISSRSIDRTLRVIKHNVEIFNKFKKIIFVFNFNDIDYNNEDFGIKNSIATYDDNAIGHFTDMVTSIVNNCTILIDPINRGWQFGAIDLAKMGYDYIKLNYNNIKWIVKTSTDIVLDERVLNVELDDEYEFIGIPFAESNTVREIAQRFNNKSMLNLILNNFECPLRYQQLYQTTFYILKNNSFDYLYYKNKFIKGIWKNWLMYKKTNNDISIDKRFGLHVETFMLNSIIRNDVKSKMIFNIDDYIFFLNLFLWITDSKIVFDASLKNILIEDYGLMHWHPEQKGFVPICINFKNRMFNFKNIKV